MECYYNTKCYWFKVLFLECTIKYQREVIKWSNFTSLVNLLGSLRSVHLWKFTRVFSQDLSNLGWAWVWTKAEWERQSQACASFDRFVVELQMVLWDWELWFWVSKRTYGTETSWVNSCELFYWFPNQSSKGGTQHSLPHQSCRVAAAVNSFLLISRLDTNAFELFFPLPG